MKILLISLFLVGCEGSGSLQMMQCLDGVLHTCFRNGICKVRYTGQFRATPKKCIIKSNKIINNNGRKNK